jgi:hypothetical protein
MSDSDRLDSMLYSLYREKKINRRPIVFADVRFFYDDCQIIQKMG